MKKTKMKKKNSTQSTQRTREMMEKKDKLILSSAFSACSALECFFRLRPRAWMC